MLKTVHVRAIKGHLCACSCFGPLLSNYGNSENPLPSCCARAAHTGLHLLPALLGAGADKPVLDLLHSVLELHRNHARDAGDTITMAFEAGSYTQARRIPAATRPLCVGL